MLLNKFNTKTRGHSFLISTGFLNKVKIFVINFIIEKYALEYS